MMVETFQVNFFSQNTYVLYDETAEAVIVDPGSYTDEEQDRIEGFLTKNKLKLKKILYTHTHLDHTFGSLRFKNKFPDISVEGHESETYFIENYRTFASVYGIEMEKPVSITHFLKDGDTVSFGNTVLRCLHVPGHSPGSICYVDEKGGVAITGDVLFAGSVGRSDLPGGDHEQLITGIKSKLMSLPYSTTVYPGHGGTTTVGKEKRMNPFLR